MAKRIFQSILIVIACLVLFFVICILVLFLAPGTEIFGIRYIANGIGAKCDIHENLAALTNREVFSGDIYLETSGVPITIEYTPYYSSNVSFAQDFVGLTRSKIRKPSLSCYVDDQDNLHIVANEIVPWVYSHKVTAEFALNLQLALNLKDRSLYISSSKSNVKIIGNPNYENFEVVTNGNIEIDGTIFATNFKYHTDGEIVIGDKITCTNADLKSSSNNILVKTPIDGDLKAETKGGKIAFVSCSNLVAKTKSGDVTHYGEGENSVAGDVQITTRSGDIVLGNISSADKGKATITSVSGSVNITNMFDGQINDDRGRIKIESARNLIINNLTGDINIGTISGGIVLNGRNGKVVLGETGIVKNPKVSTTTGTITVMNASGVVDLSSTNNAVTIENKDATKFNLVAGRKLTANHLTGEVVAESNGDTSLIFDQTPKNVTLNVGSRADKVIIRIPTASYITVNYDLRSTKGAEASLYAGDELIYKSSSLTSTMVAGFPTIKVTTKYAKIYLYLAQ